MKKYAFLVFAFFLGLVIGYLIGLAQPKKLSFEQFAKIKYAIDQFCISQGYLRGGYLVFDYTNSSEILVRCINISYLQRKDFKIEDVKI